MSIGRKGRVFVAGEYSITFRRQTLTLNPDPPLQLCSISMGRLSYFVIASSGYRTCFHTDEEFHAVV